MKKELDHNLTQIRNFLSTLRTQNPTKEEVLNYLLSCKAFVFSKHGINENDYNITIHFTRSKELDFDEAKMCADAKDPKKFDITLNSQKLSNKYSLQSSKKNNETLNEIELLEKRQASVLTLTISFLHELGHVFQYILTQKQWKLKMKIKML